MSINSSLNEVVAIAGSPARITLLGISLRLMISKVFPLSQTIVQKDPALINAFSNPKARVLIEIGAKPIAIIFQRFCPIRNPRSA